MNTHPLTDHLGHTYSSIKEMCMHYQIPENTYHRRRGLGWSIERCLTTPVKSKKPAYGVIWDHLLNEYPDIPAMCRHYGIDPVAFWERRCWGWSLAEVLLTPMSSQRKDCVDHRQQSFTSLEDMCRYYGVSCQIYRQRVQTGWSVERALTTPVGDHTRKCQDHLGQEFPSLLAMCEHYGISFKLYQNRIRYGWSLEEALTKPVKKYRPRAERENAAGKIAKK